MLRSGFLVSSSDSFDVSFFRISKWILGFLGCWPLDPLGRITKIKLVLNFSFLLTAIIGEIRLAWFLRREPLRALDVICPCVTKMVTGMKLICFLVYRKDIALIIKSLYEHFETDTKNFKKSTLIAKVCFITNMWCFVLYMNALSASSMFILKPITIWVYQFIITGQTNYWIALPYQAALPYEDMSQMNDKTLYAFIYCIVGYAGTITTFGISGTDGAFLCFCLYISGAYQCLQEDFMRTVKAHTSKDLDSASHDSNEVLYNNLTELVRRQQKIDQLFKSFNRVYKFITFIHFVSASLSLAILLVILTLTSGFFKLNYIIYVLGISNHLFACCYGAESVDENCLKLSEVLYFCDWYKCNKKVKLLILFALIKSQRGSPMKAPFFTPSLPLFASIIQTSGSYFTILQTVL